jgi:hypothetical protein
MRVGARKSCNPACPPSAQEPPLYDAVLPRAPTFRFPVSDLLLGRRAGPHSAPTLAFLDRALDLEADLRVFFGTDLEHESQSLPAARGRLKQEVWCTGDTEPCLGHACLFLLRGKQTEARDPSGQYAHYVTSPKTTRATPPSSCKPGFTRCNPCPHLGGGVLAEKRSGVGQKNNEIWKRIERAKRKRQGREEI